MSFCEQQRAARAMLRIMNKHQLYCSGCAWNTISGGCRKVIQVSQIQTILPSFCPRMKMPNVMKIDPSQKSNHYYKKNGGRKTPHFVMHFIWKWKGMP